MNLGYIALMSCLALCILGGLLSFAVAYLVARLIRARELAILCFVLLFPVSVWKLNSLYHQQLFARWHQVQNKVVPYSFPCLAYEPSYMTLRAKYRMTEAEFNQWVASHPWPLRPYPLDDMSLFHDSEWLGEGFQGKALATEIEPNGKQLRVFHSGDTTYVVYHAF